MLKRLLAKKYSKDRLYLCFVSIIKKVNVRSVPNDPFAYITNYRFTPQGYRFCIKKQNEYEETNYQDVLNNKIYKIWNNTDEIGAEVVRDVQSMSYTFTKEKYTKEELSMILDEINKRYRYKVNENLQNENKKDNVSES